MQGNGEVVIVDAPQFLKEEFGLTARVDEDERGPVALHEIVDLAERVARGVAGPGQMLLRIEHCDLRRGAGIRHHQIGARFTARRLRHQIAAEFVGFGDSRRKADGGQLRRQREQPRKPERQQVAALRRHQRMQLVEHHAPERAEQIRRVGRGEQQRKLLGRGEQDVRRMASLPLPPGGGRVAGAGLQPHVQRHFPDGNFQVARNVNRQRLERGDVQCVEASSFSPLAGRRWRGAQRRAG